VKKWIITILVIIGIFQIVRYLQYQNLSDRGDILNEEEPIILTVLAGQSTSDAGIEDMINEALVENFPEVQLEWECVDWGENFDSQIQARIAAGDVPDIMVGKAQDVAAYAAGGNLAPISTSSTDKIKEQALQAVTMEGVVYGLPYNALYQGVIYNKALFEKFDLKPPTTLEKLDEIVSILNENQITPFAAHFQESWKVGNMTMQFLMNNILREEPNWGELFRKNEVDFSDNKKVKACLEQNQYILTNSWADAMMIDQYESDRRFLEGEAAIYLTGSWSLQSVNQYNMDQEYGIFPFPNKSGDSYLIRETNMTFMKSNTSKHGELVDQILVELVTNKTLIQDILDFTQTFSTIKDIEPKYKSIIEVDVIWFEENNQVVEVTAGNNQLVWTFQNDLAMKLQEWLQEKIPLEDVLSYADKHRLESSN
jgi:ABC-type glycerol-3-phosphate transport system substrate-binding protein